MRFETQPRVHLLIFRGHSMIKTNIKGENCSTKMTFTFISG